MPLKEESQGQDGRIFKVIYISWKIILEPMTVNIIISEVDDLTYVVLSKAKKHVPYGGVFGTTEYITL
jgi:hypothetical protein